VGVVFNHDQEVYQAELIAVGNRSHNIILPIKIAYGTAGVLEYWSYGVMIWCGKREFFNTPILQYSITPVPKNSQSIFPLDWDILTPTVSGRRFSM
jgi:hypothetical protein